MSSSLIVASTNLGPLLVVLGVVLAFVVFALVSLVVVGFRKGLGFVSLAPIALLFGAFQTGLDNRIRFAVGLVGVAGGVAIVLVPARQESWFRKGLKRRSTIVLSAIGILGLTVVTVNLVSGMFSSAHLVVDDSASVVVPAGVDIVVKDVIVRPGALPPQTSVGPLRASGAGLQIDVARQQSDDVSCGLCDSHYRIVIGRQLASPALEQVADSRVRLSVGVETPHLFVDAVPENPLEFAVTDVPVDPISIEFGDSLSAKVFPERPFELIRATTSISAGAMASPSLAEWPAYWAAHSEVLLGEDGTVEPLFKHYEGKFGPQLCAVGAPCDNAAVSLIVPREVAESGTELSAWVSGTVEYLTPPQSPSDTEIEVSLATPVFWVVKDVDGVAVPEHSHTDVTFAFRFKAEDLEDGTPFVAVVTTDGDSQPSYPVLGICDTGTCYVALEKYIEGKAGEPLEWHFDLHFGFFVESPPSFELAAIEPVVSFHNDQL